MHSRWADEEASVTLDERWDELTDADWAEFAKAWLHELDDSVGAAAVDANPNESCLDQSVVLMNFTARPEHQWRFIRKAVALAESDRALGHIAAGPMEHLLGWHGESFIAQVEHCAAVNPAFARMLTGVCKYKLSDSLWARVQALQGRVRNPLTPDGAA